MSGGIYSALSGMQVRMEDLDRVASDLANVGTAGYKVDLTLVSPYVFWYGAVALIVLGHVVAVVLAHAAALRLFPGRAVSSQGPMMALMVGYTILSLWILAQPVVG